MRNRIEVLEDLKKLPTSRNNNNSNEDKTKNWEKVYSPN